MMYGYTLDYVRNLTFSEIEQLYSIGKKIDLKRRGFDLDEKPTIEEREEAWEKYYTPEEQEIVKKHYGSK